MSDIDNGGGCVCVGEEGINGKIFVSSAKIFCEPKTAKKNKIKCT